MGLKLLQPCCCDVAGPWDVYAEVEASTTNLIVRTATWHPYTPPPYDSSPSVDLVDEWEWAIEIPDTRHGHLFQGKTQETSLAPFGSDELIYLAMQNAGPSKTREPKYDFDVDLEGFAGSGDAVVTFGRATSDGAPGSTTACAYFRITDPTAKGGTRTKRMAHSGKTWEDYGVEAGASVIEVEFIQLFRRVYNTTDKLTSHSLSLDVVDGGGSTVLDAPLHTASLPTTTSGWTQLVPATDNERRGVLLASQASNSPANIELTYSATLNSNAGDPNEEVRIDILEVWIYYSYSTQHANCKVDVPGKAVVWIVPDSSWESYAWRKTQNSNAALPFYNATAGLPLYPLAAMDEAQDTLFNPGEGSPWALENNGLDINWMGASSTTLRQWNWDDPDGFYYWEIDSDGAKTYHESHPITVWKEVIGPCVGYPLGAGPTDWDYPRYTYLGGPQYFNASEGPMENEKVDYQSWAMPIGHLTQSDRAIGLKYPHILDAPNDFADYEQSAGDTYTAAAQVVVGALVLHDVIDGHYMPYVSGTTLLDLSFEATYCGAEITNLSYDPVADAAWDDWTDDWSGAMDAPYTLRVTHADAGPSSALCTAEATIRDDFRYYDQYAQYAGGGGPDTDKVVGKYWYANRTQYWCYLQVDAYQESYLVREVLSDEATDTTYETIYPKWIETRALQRAGGATVLEVVPKDQAEADSRFGGDTAQVAMRLRRFASGAEDFSLETPLNYTTQASGTTTIDTTNSAEIMLTAVRGGPADGQTTISLTVTIHQVAGGAYERAEYDGGTDTLAVYLDIDGGHDTVADLAEVIAQAGDFDCSVVSYSTDTISDGMDVTTCVLTGGSTTLAGYSGSPTVWDSSDDFFYVTGFPMRVMVACSTDITGRERWRMCSQTDAYVTYPTAWAVAHDGDTRNPCGIGAEGGYRPGPTTEAHMGVRSWNTVKNTAAATLCPPAGVWDADTL